MADVVDRYVITVDADGAIKNLERFEGAQRAVNKQTVQQDFVLGEAEKAMLEYDHILNEVVASAKKTSAESKRVSDAVDRQRESLGGAAKDAINYAVKLAVIYEAAKKVGAVLLDSVKAAAENERAQRDLAAAIRLVGGDVSKLLPKFSQQATELQRLTGLQDEQIQSLQAQALRYGAATSDVEKLVEASIRLGSVTGQDVNTAMQGLIKTTQGVQDKTLSLIPGVRELTEEQLRNGDAIRIVNERFAEALTISSPLEEAWARVKNATGDLNEAFGDAFVRGTALTQVLHGIATGLDAVADAAVAEGFGGATGAIATFLAAAFGTEKDQESVLRPREQRLTDRLVGSAASRKATAADFGDWSDTSTGSLSFAATKTGKAGGGKTDGPSVELDFAGSAADWRAQELAAAQQTIDAKLAMRLRGVELEASIEDQRLAMLDEKWQQEQALQAQASNAMLQTTLAASQAASSVGIQSLIRWASGAKVSAREVGAAMVATFGQQLVSQGTLHLWSGIAGTMDPLMGNPALIGVGLKEIAIGGAMAAAGGRLGAGGGHGGGGGGGSARAPSAGGFQGGVGGGSEVGRNGSGGRKITVIVEGWMSPEEAGHRTKKAIEEANRVGL